MKVFHSPGACSLGIVMLLEEAGAPYEVQVVNVRAGEQRQPAYLAVNPKGKVPALVRDDGSLLTEFPAIAYWLAATYPDARLLPEGPDGVARALEVMDYIVSSLHMRGYTLIMRPANFAEDEAIHPQIADKGRAVLKGGLAQLEDILGDKPFLLGDHLTVADAAAFYLLSWQPRFGFELPEKLQAYFDRLKARPSGQVALPA